MIKGSDNEIYYCSKCNYQTCHLGHWQRHLNTKKHLSFQKTNIKTTATFSKNINQYECSCGKKYKYHQGLYRHKKICKHVDKSESIIKELNNNALIETLNDMNNSLKQVVNHTYTTNIQTQNNTNIMLYLNNECSNAVSIQDFIEQLSLTARDLKILKSDKPQAIANIVKQNLEPLSITDRPIHNTSTKDWFVKDKLEGWQEDSGEKIVKNVENGIIKNWPKLYESINPDWIKNHKSQNEFVELTNLTTSNMNTKMKNAVIDKIKDPTTLE